MENNESSRKEIAEHSRHLDGVGGGICNERKSTADAVEQFPPPGRDREKDVFHSEQPAIRRGRQ